MARLRAKSSLAAAILLSNTAVSAANAQEAAAPTAADQAKAQADLASAQLANAKALQDLIAANKQATEGKATLATVENGAEVLLLRRQMERQIAAELASKAGCAAGRKIVLVFGNQAPTTAHYLGVRHASDELNHNFDMALKMAHAVFDEPTIKPKPKPRPKGGSPYDLTVESLAGAAIGGGPLGAASVGVTALSTLVSLLQVDTSVTGGSLNSTADSLGPLVAEQLRADGWDVQAPNNIAYKTDFADGLVDKLRGKRDDAAHYYGIYLARLKTAGDKPEQLPETVRVAGAALATVITNYSTLIDGLFTPTDAGVLPATLVEQEKTLADAAETGNQSVLYVDTHEAALTSITKKGFLTGIGGGIPAWLAASGTISYTLARGKDDTEFGAVDYHTPVTRLDRVASWSPAAPSSVCTARAAPAAR